MAGLINSGILTNPKARSFGNAFADQGMRFAPTTAPTTPQPDPFAPMPASAPQPTPFKGEVASTSQALTATPAPSVDSRGYPTTPPAGSVDSRGYPTAPSKLPDSRGYYVSDAAAQAAQSHALDTAMTPRGSQASSGIDWSAWANTPQSNEEAYNQLMAREDAADQTAGASLGAAARQHTPEEEKIIHDHAAAEFAAGKSTFDPDTPAGSGVKVAGPPAAVPPGKLEDPGADEQIFDQTKDQMMQPGDPATQALIDQMMREGGLAPQDFDQFYKNAWEHSARDLNSEYAGRGMGNSSDAMRALGHSRSDLAAQQSKDEADYAMKSWENNINRIATAAKLQGGIKAGDVERWTALQQGAKMAQGSEEGRVRGQVEDTLGAFNSLYPKAAAALEGMSTADADIAKQIFMSIPAEFQDQANFEAAVHAKAEGGWAAFVKALMGGA